MMPAYTSMESHPYQRNQMPFSRSYHPAIHPQMKVDPFKLLFNYEQPWPYAGSYGNLTPVHLCYGHNNFPAYYSHRPAYFHAPAPSPIYYSGDCPEYIEPFSIPFSPPPHYSMELPRYEYDVCVPREKVDVCVAGDKVDNALAPVELKNYSYPFIWIPSEYISNGEVKSSVIVKVGEKDNILQDRKPPSPEYFRAAALDRRVLNQRFPFDINSRWNMLGRRNQNWQTNEKKTSANEGADYKGKSHSQKTSNMPKGVYENSFASTGTKGSWTNGDKYEIKENKVEKTVENIIKEEVSEPREVRRSVKPNHDECRKERNVLSDEEAAVLIQAAYRGFQERKWEPLKKLKQMAEVSKQVTDVSSRIQALEASYDLQNDDKQIIIIEETIMRLLLKLDTIQGLRPIFREIRKSLARELTSLQEKLDSIMAKKSQQRMQQLFNRKAVEDTPLNTQIGEYLQEHQEEKVEAPEEGSSEGLSHGSYDVLEQCQDGFSMKDGIHSLDDDDGRSESRSPLEPASDEGTDPIVLTNEIVNKDVSQVVTIDACNSKSGLSETEKMVVERETKLEVECQSGKVGNDTMQSSLTTKSSGDEVAQGDASLQVNDEMNIQPGAVEFGIRIGAEVPFNELPKEEEEPEEKVAFGEKNEVSASKELPVTEHDGGLNGNKKLVEENNKLREMMRKLTEAGYQQLTAISDLTGRVKDLEKKLARTRSKRVRTRTKIKCYRSPTSKPSNNPLQGLH